MTRTRDDIATVVAIAVLASCAATVAHEAVGHGLTCLALGGEITRLTSVYFQCSAQSTAIAAGGPVGNLAAAALSWWAFTLLPPDNKRGRLFLLLTMAFSIFWFAGYLIYSAALNTGDLYFVAGNLFGDPSVALRIGAIVAATAIYLLGVNVVRRLTEHLSRDSKRMRVLLFFAWLAASLSAFTAALLYAPDRWGAAGQAALQIGAASLPLLSRAVVTSIGAAETDATIKRSWSWIAITLIAYAAFVLTLGRGLP